MRATMRETTASLMDAEFLKDKLMALHCRFLQFLSEQCTVRRCVSPSRSTPLLLATSCPSGVPTNETGQHQRRLRCARGLLDSRDCEAHTRRHAQARAQAVGGIENSLRPLAFALAPCTGVLLQLFSCWSNETSGSNARKKCPHVRPRPQQRGSRRPRPQQRASMHAASSPRAVHRARACEAATNGGRQAAVNARESKHLQAIGAKQMVQNQRSPGLWNSTKSGENTSRCCPPYFCAAAGRQATRTGLRTALAQPVLTDRWRPRAAPCGGARTPGRGQAHK